MRTGETGQLAFRAGRGRARAAVQRAEATGAVGAPRPRLGAAAMEGDLQSGQPGQPPRGQDGRGLGEVLEPQPLATGPAVRAEAPVETTAAPEESAPTAQVAAAQGAAVTKDVQPEQVQVQVAAAKGADGSPVPATVAAAGPVTAAAMEGAMGAGQAATGGGVPGAQTTAVFSGEASGVAAETGAAMATGISPVRSAAPATPTPVRTPTSVGMVGHQRAWALGRVPASSAPATVPVAIGRSPSTSPTATPSSRLKRRAARPGDTEGSSKAAKRASATPASPGTGGTGERVEGTGEEAAATGSYEDWYTRKGEIGQMELLDALLKSEPFTFVRQQGTPMAYASRDPTVRPPPALAALKLEEVLSLQWDTEKYPVLKTGPTLPFWDPRIHRDQIKGGQVQLSNEELMWREITFTGRRNLYKIRKGRASDVERVAQIDAAYTAHKEAFRVAHKEQLAKEKQDTAVYGVEEAEAVLAARALPVPVGTGKEPVEEEEEEEDAELEMVVRRSLQPPPTGGGTHDVEAGTSGIARQRAVTPLRQPSPVATGSAATGSVPGTSAPPVPGTASPVPSTQEDTGPMVPIKELEILWMHMGMMIRRMLRNTGRTEEGTMDDPRITELLDEHEEDIRQVQKAHGL